MRSLWGHITKKPLKPLFAIASKTVLNNLDEKAKREVFNMLCPESMAVTKEIVNGVEVDFSKINCPRLVIACEQDALALPVMQRDLADLLKADYISYPQFAHIPMLEKGWEKGAEDIKAWLEKNVR
jgi:pimeloyl-ACP methyl ester carboxylesterase